MAEQLILTSKSELQPLADSVKELKGTSDSITWEEMEDIVEATNGEINSQTALLAQIQTALEGKAAGSGGSYDPVTMTWSGNSKLYVDINYIGFNDGALTISHVLQSGSFDIVVAPNSIVTITANGTGAYGFDATPSVMAGSDTGTTILSYDLDNISVHIGSGDCRVTRGYGPW